MDFSFRLGWGCSSAPPQNPGVTSLVMGLTVVAFGAISFADIICPRWPVGV
ncbi:MAG: hypothetical protein PF442_01700 [Desulfobulbaceae bacterium]|nr:hypothetical protein [Desulfobulbaceae bacterium]